MLGKDYYVTLKILGQECSADLTNVASAKFQELRGKLYDAVSTPFCFYYLFNSYTCISLLLNMVRNLKIIGTSKVIIEEVSKRPNLQTDICKIKM